MILDRPVTLLRLEGLALAAGALVVFLALDGTWWWLPVLFLVPDLSMLGYLAGPRVGAMTYNLGHATVLPTAVGLLGLWLDSDVTMSLALIWLFHIGVDRLAGYGLKEPSGFGETHLGRVGRDRSGPPVRPAA